MNNSVKKSKYRQAFAVPTEQVIRKAIIEANPVTRSVYIDIIGHRIDRLELFRLNTLDEVNNERN